MELIILMFVLWLIQGMIEGIKNPPRKAGKKKVKRQTRNTRNQHEEDDYYNALFGG